MKNIVLVDDDAGFNFLNSRILKNLGVVQNLHICVSAPTALQLINEIYENKNEIVDLVLLDIKMPVIDGFGFLNLLQNTDINIRTDIKVAMLTSSVDPDDRYRSYTYPQVIDFIEKPLDPGKFFKTIRKIRSNKTKLQ